LGPPRWSGLPVSFCAGAPGHSTTFALVLLVGAFLGAPNTRSPQCPLPEVSFLTWNWGSWVGGSGGLGGGGCGFFFLGGGGVFGGGGVLWGGFWVGGGFLGGGGGGGGGGGVGLGWGGGFVGWGGVGWVWGGWGGGGPQPVFFFERKACCRGGFSATPS